MSDKMREEFEKWALSNDGPSVSVTRNDVGRYEDDDLNMAWLGWQAARTVPILQLPVFQFDEGMVACGFMEHDSGYGITLHKSAVAGVAGQDVPDENLDKISTPLTVMLFTSETHARDVYRALIAAPEGKK